jgi:O-antigen ligase
MISDAPLLGFGYGTFADAFPMYRDRSLSVLNVWDKAHNSYLEVFQGLGLVFGALLLAGLVLLVHSCFRGALKRRRDAVSPLVAVAAAVLVASHALVDFSMQIQSVTLTFMALLGGGVAQSRSSSESLHD